MNVGSLFSGIGGIELGFAREGFHTSWFVENNDYCQRVLRKHFPDRPIFSDIHAVDFKSVPPVDILVGGFPCQDISHAGKRKGITGERSSLWKEYHRAIGEIRPRYAVIENVSNLTNIGLDVVLADLAQIGYDAEWVCLRASDFGALHRRERIFIIAYPNRDGESNSSFNEEKIQGELGETDVANSSSESSRMEEHRSGRQGRESTSASQSKVVRQENGEIGSEGHSTRISSNTSRGNGETGKPIHPRKSYYQRCIIADDLRERIARFREETLSGKSGLSWGKDIRSTEDLKGRRDIPEPLLRGSRNGISNYVDRITAIGNAVVPDCAQFIARQIKEAEA